MSIAKFERCQLECGIQRWTYEKSRRLMKHMQKFASCVIQSSD